MKKNNFKEAIRQGLECLEEVMMEFLVYRKQLNDSRAQSNSNTSDNPDTPANPKTPVSSKTPNSANSCSLFFDFLATEEPVSHEISQAIETINTKKEFERECNSFRAMIAD